MTNTFRPVLYVQKTLASVPEGTTLSEEQKTFTFQLKAGGKAVANAEYWYVDRADTTGATPKQKEVEIKVTGKDGQVTTKKVTTGKTGADGTFILRAGEIIALFPGTVGTSYELKELQYGDKEGVKEEVRTGADWICETPAISGTLEAKGFSKIFVNNYRWKDLYVTKEINHLEKEDYDKLPLPEKTFTFQVFEAKTDPVTGELVDKDGVPLKKDEEPVPVTQADGKTYTTDGLHWEIQVEDTATAQPGAKQPDLGPTEGKVNSDGTFTCALGFRKVKITGSATNKGFEAKKTYIVKEITIPTGINEPGKDQVLYNAIVDADQVQMPVSSSKEEATIINDYQRRSLSVSKSVIFSKQRPEQEPKFTFRIQADGETDRTYQYDVVDAQGNLVVAEEDFFGRPVRYKENLSAENGQFTLSDGETAVFKSIGMLGDSFQVCEQVNDEYQQIAPSMTEEDKANEWGKVSTVTLSDEDNKLSFINGQKGSLYISKEYVKGDGSEHSSQNYIDALKEDIREAEWVVVEGSGQSLMIPNDGEGRNVNISESMVEFTLQIIPKEGDPYIWPPQNIAQQDKDYVEVSCINQLNGKAGTIRWKVGESVKVYPWVLLILSEAIPEDATYILQEEPEYQHQIKTEEYSSLLWQINQVVPANDQAVTGVVGTDAMARICNEVTMLQIGADVFKQMTEYSDPVPSGAVLTWRVEQYNEATKTWSPAEGIPYVVFDYKEESGHNIVDKLVSDQIEKTGSNGKITLIKSDNGDPKVYFIENEVYLNLYAQNKIEEWLEYHKGYSIKLLRIVEVPEESDPEWGKLAMYKNINGVYTQDQGLYQHSFVIDPWFGNLERMINTFVNSNKEDTIAVKKALTEGAASTDQQFTMILKQVVSFAPGSFKKVSIQEHLAIPETDAKEAMENAVLEPRGNVPYIIHKPDGTTEEGLTTLKGEIKLHAGEYATLDLPEGTLWTLTENLQAVPYTLHNLTPDDALLSNDPSEQYDKNYAPLRKLDANLMLINVQEPKKNQYSLKYSMNGGLGMPGIFPPESKDSFSESYTFTITSKKPIHQNKLEFLGWSTNKDATSAEYQPGETITATSENPNITLHAVWETPVAKKTVYQVSFVRLTEVPEGISNNHYFLENSIGQEAIKNGVTLLYQITISGDEGAAYTIDGSGINAINTSSLTGTIGSKGTEVIYVEKFFGEDSIQIDNNGRQEIVAEIGFKPGKNTTQHWMVSSKLIVHTSIITE